MRAIEFITEEVGRVLDLTKNYPHYSTLKGKILDISPKGKYKIQIIDAKIIPGKKASVKIGDTVAINANFLKQALKESELEEDWKKTLGGIAAAGALALPGNMMHKPATEHPPVVQTEKADPSVVKQVAASMATPIGQALKRAAATIKNKAERAQFLAQCAHETLNFSTLKEKGGTLDFRKYDPRFNPSKARALGNDKPGDGARYAGRGYIQLTGKANYQKAGDELGIPLEKHPQLAERPDIAAQVALWYWHHRVTPKVSNFNNTKAVTKPINSHLNGLEDRHQKFLAFSELLGNNNAPSQGLEEHEMDNTDGWAPLQ